MSMFDTSKLKALEMWACLMYLLHEVCIFYHGYLQYCAFGVVLPSEPGIYGTFRMLIMANG